MGIFIDNVSVYCDTDNCDSKVEIEVTEGSELGWINEMSDSLSSSWDIEMQNNKTHFVRCPECSARYWDSVGMLEEKV